MDYNKKHELLRSIRPFKCVMIPNSVDEISEIGLEGLYVALIDRVTVEIIDSEGRRIGIVGGEIQDGGCRRAFPIYLRDLIQCKDALAVRDEAHLMYKIEQLVDSSFGIDACEVCQDAAGIPAEDAGLARHELGEEIEAGIQQVGILLAQAAKLLGGSVFGAGFRRR